MFGTLKKHNALKSMLRLAENPCYVISVPDFKNLNAALPIVKQRLCEIMSNDALNPRAQITSRRPKRVNVCYHDLSAGINIVQLF